MAKPSKPSVLPQTTVRTRRAYFDFRFGQLHVRTAFPGTGGFDEQVTLFCLHSREGSSRSFARFLPEIADDRSVYAPDLPGFGESDPAPSATFADAARAVLDLTSDLRLRQVDVLGVGFGAAVALELAATDRTSFAVWFWWARPPWIASRPSSSRASSCASSRTRTRRTGTRRRCLPARGSRSLPSAARGSVRCGCPSARQANQRFPQQLSGAGNERPVPCASTSTSARRASARGERRTSGSRPGRVTLNGAPATLGHKVAPGDEVRIDGRLIGAKKKADLHRAQQARRHHLHHRGARRGQHRPVRGPQRADLSRWAASTRIRRA